MDSPLLSAFTSRTAPAAAPQPGFSVDPKTVKRRQQILKMLGGPTAEAYQTAYEAGKQYAAGDRNAPVALANVLSGLPSVKPRYTQ